MKFFQIQIQKELCIKREEKPRITITGQNGNNSYSQSLDLASTGPSDKNAALRQLWARKKLSFLSDFNTAYGENGNKEEIVNLGMRYNLLTAHTSFVAVHEVVRNPEAQSRDIRQPLSLPAGVSEFAVGGGMLNAPEPEFYLLILMAFLIVLSAALKQMRRSAENRS